ncbi:Putative steryl acetyl hydrolase mug81 [Sporothrix curviconia]|uniref:Steryl acetyl hydrolase mug81 n=1 Tax=Sporothrix curviconia TaxID=1260050 RepID=A0ABP0CFE1_9PEZI
MPSTLDSAEEADMSFTTAKDVFAVLERTDGDALTVSNVPARAMQDMDRERDKRGRKVRFFYFSEQKLLIITIPTAPHERMHLSLQGWFLNSVYSMGLYSSWEETAATRLKRGE